MALVLLFTSLFASTYGASVSGLGQGEESGIYSEHLHDNFQLVWPTNDIKDYAEARTLEKDLVDVTVSFWASHSYPSDPSIAWFSYGTEEVPLALELHRGTDWHFYIRVNGQYIKCPGYQLKTSWQHFLVTWSNIKGEMRIWIDEKIFCSSNLKKGDTIKKGGNFTLGQHVNKWNPRNTLSGYTFRGNMAYFNIYDKFVNSTEEYAKIKEMAMSDEDALISWEEFRKDTHGSVRILPEYDLYSKAFTHIECTPHNMTLHLRRQGFQHLQPDDLVLLDNECGATSVNETYLTFTTDLLECGTLVNYTDSYVLYTNEIKSKDAQPKVLQASVDVINRRPVPKRQKRISFQCEYDLADRVHKPVYAAHINNIQNYGHGRDRFKYRISLYHGSDYEVPYSQSEYPIQIEMEERVYVEVAVEGRETRLENWINNCRATPSANFKDSISYDLIKDGCPNPSDDSLKFHESGDFASKRFSFGTFRFNQFPSAVIFLHCDMILCNKDDSNSRCSKGFSIC